MMADIVYASLGYPPRYLTITDAVEHSLKPYSSYGSGKLEDLEEEVRETRRGFALLVTMLVDKGTLTLDDVVEFCNKGATSFPSFAKVEFQP